MSLLLLFNCISTKAGSAFSLHETMVSPRRSSSALQLPHLRAPSEFSVSPGTSNDPTDGKCIQPQFQTYTHFSNLQLNLVFKVSLSPESNSRKSVHQFSWNLSYLIPCLTCCRGIPPKKTISRVKIQRAIQQPCGTEVHHLVHPSHQMQCCNSKGWRCVHVGRRAP